jgi:hypothetical protein
LIKADRIIDYNIVQNIFFLDEVVGGRLKKQKLTHPQIIEYSIVQNKISALFMINYFLVPWKASALSERQKQSKD